MKWLVILGVSLVLFALHAVYVSRRMSRALEAVLPRLRPHLRRIRIAYLVVACSLPVLLVGYAAWALVTRPEAIGAPESWVYDVFILYPFWLVTLVSFQVTLLVVPLDLVHLGLARLGVLAGDRWRRRRHALVLAIAAVFAVYVPARVIVDGRSLEVRRHTHTSAEVPPALDGFRIALVGDLQADRYTDEARMAQLVDAANRMEPDLVLIAGDMITRAPQYIEPAAEQAGRLRAEHGVLAAIGDHDNFAYLDRERSLREVQEALARHGVPMLDNEVRRIQVGGAEIAVVLATHNYVNPIDPDTLRRLLERTAGSDVQVVVAHQTSPELLELAREAGVELFLGAHTHGGQVRFWLPLLDLTPARLETRYVEGSYRLGAMTLVVTAGLGMSVTPLRYRSPASVDVIELRAAAPARPAGQP